MRSTPGRAGLTLVEVLVALLILATGVLTTVASQVAIARLSAHAVANSRSATRAASIIDSLRALPCARLGPGSQTTTTARFSWNFTTLGELRALRLDVSPVHGAPWHAETLLPCV